MAFALIAGGVFGAPESMVQDFFTVWGFGSMLVPLAVFELYRKARAGSLAARSAMAGALVAVTLLMTVGIGGATLMMWLPPLRASGLFG
jgi:hypothetical protein